MTKSHQKSTPNRVCIKTGKNANKQRKTSSQNRQHFELQQQKQVRNPRREENIGRRSEIPF
jgi:hypothetical protein